MRLINTTPIALAVSAALTTSLQVSTAFAQDSESMLEEVMVTARKREESLAETPIAITAISAA